MARVGDEARVEERRTRIARLLVSVERPSVRHLAEMLGMPRSTVHRDIKIIRREWQEARLQDAGEAIAQELARIDQVEQEAWLALHQSKRDEQTQRTVTTTEGEGPAAAVKVTTTDERKGREAAAEYMRVILQCSERRSRLKGLDEPQVVNLLAGGKKVKVTLNIGENKPIDPDDYPTAVEGESTDRATLDDLEETAGE